MLKRSCMRRLTCTLEKINKIVYKNKKLALILNPVAHLYYNNIDKFGSRHEFMMKPTMYYNGLAIAAGALLLLVTVVVAAPVDQEDEQQENTLIGHPGSSETEYAPAWDAIDTAALRKLLMQIDADDRLGRVSRSLPQAEPLRALDGRLARQRRTDKRRVRFQQCYFNPITCFGK